VSIKTATNGHHRKTVAGFFSRSANEWDTVYKREERVSAEFQKWRVPHRKEIVCAQLKDYGPKFSKTVVDIGCGTGNVAESLVSPGDIVLGTDIAIGMLKEAMIKPALRGKIINADVESLPFKSNSMDAVICIGVLPYLLNDRSGVKELTRICKDNGIVIVVLPNIFKLYLLADPFYILGALIKKISKRNHAANDANLAHLAIRNYSYFQVKKLFTGRSGPCLNITGIGFGPFTIDGKNIFPPGFSNTLSRTGERLCATILFKWLVLFANQWSACYRISKSHQQ
jgi:ubiquinone/menaquinone biosynthesis C-methylase UbiE